MEQEMMMFFYDLLLAAGALLSRRPAAHCPRKSGVRDPPCPEPRPRTRRSINVAVTGPVGSGKSTLVRAMVGAPLEEEGEDDEGVFPDDPHGQPKPYAFPGNPQVVLWDLPGVEARQREQADTAELASYDFFVVTTSSRAGDEVLRLAREIERQGKQFVLVRTKMDVYARETRQGNFGQADLLREIRRHFVKQLLAAGVQAPRVFLLSARQPGAFDFPDFMRAFSGEFPSRY